MEPQLRSLTYFHYDQHKRSNASQAWSALPCIQNVDQKALPGSPMPFFHTKL